MVFLIVLPRLCGSSTQGSNYSVFSQGEPWSKHRHGEGDTTCCKFITLPRCLVLVLRAPVSPTHSGNGTLSTTDLRIVIQLVGTDNQHVVQLPKCQQEMCRRASIPAWEGGVGNSASGCVPPTRRTARRSRRTVAAHQLVLLKRLPSPTGALRRKLPAWER